MADRSTDWFHQAERDAGQAADSQAAGRHEWACFAAHQAAEKAVKALHLARGQEAWGPVVSRLLSELPEPPPPDLVERARVLDNHSIPARYPDSHPEGAPFSTSDPSRAATPSTMPVRSLHTSVMRWPDRAAVRRAVADWAAALAAEHPEVAAVGYFGSLAREAGWGVGSDADLVVLVDGATEPFERRGSTLDTSGLPVPTDLLVYDLAEWSAGLTGNPFRDRMRREVVWVHGVRADVTGPDS